MMKTILFFSMLLTIIVQSIGLTQTQEIQNNKVSITVGFPQDYFADIDIRDARAAIEIWANNLQLVKSTNFSLQLLLFSDTQTLEEAFNQNKVDLFFLPSLEFIKLKNRIPLEPVATGNHGQDYGENFILLVNKKASITKISDLKNKELLIHADGSNELINLWLDVLLYNNNLPKVDKCFIKVSNVSRANQAILPVFFNQKDVCIIKKATFTSQYKLNPQIQKNMIFLAESPNYIREVFCYNSNFGSRERELFSKILWSINDDPTGQQILSLFKTQTIVPYKPEYLENLSDLLKQHALIRQ